jgi:hypothetical protein
MKHFTMLMLVSSLLYVSCNSTGYKAQPDQLNAKEVYGFLNYLLSMRDSIGHTEVLFVADHDKDYDDLASPGSFTFYKSLSIADSSFKNTSRDFVLSQLALIPTFGLDQKFIKGKKVLSSEEIEEYRQSGREALWTHLKTKYNCETYTTVSLPIFSKDYSTVAVAAQYYTNANGGGVVWLFKKINNKWVYKDQLDFWDN